MELVITLRKTVPNRNQGEQIFELVKQKLADRPDIKVTGHVTNHFDSEVEPDGPD